MKNKNPVTVVLSDHTLAVFEALMLRQQVSADNLISSMIWDVSRYVFTPKEIMLIAETVEVKK